MYSTCIFCHSALGRNESVEHFPVGRKLAFDGAKGRLWVVCARCGRWNLTPLEERWEAIGECERQYRGTRLRASTDQIGLARLREGTDLIRIGSPLRPEFAAWRYARHFRRRRRNDYMWSALSGGGLVLVLIGGVAGIPMLFGPVIVPVIERVRSAMRKRTELGRAERVIKSRVRAETGLKVGKAELVDVRIISSADEQGWALRFAHSAKFVDFTGPEALHTAHLVSPILNAYGARQSSIDSAVRELERSHSPDEYFKTVLRFGQDRGWKYTGLQDYPEPMRLAFEMASHEESERRALDGELDRLEQDWKEAEEIAAIADNLFLPKSVTDWLDRHRPR